MTAIRGLLTDAGAEDLSSSVGTTKLLAPWSSFGLKVV